MRLFICALWSPAGKGLTSWLSFGVCNCKFVTFPLVSIVCGRVPWLYQYWPDGFMLFVVLCPGTPEGSTGSGSGFKASQKTGNGLKSHPTDWEKPEIEPATPGIQDIGLSPTPRRLLLGQVWYLIVSIPDLCTFTYFEFLNFEILERFQIL